MRIAVGHPTRCPPSGSRERVDDPAYGRIRDRRSACNHVRLRLAAQSAHTHILLTFLRGVAGRAPVWGSRYGSRLWSFGPDPGNAEGHARRPQPPVTWALQERWRTSNIARRDSNDTFTLESTGAQAGHDFPGWPGGPGDNHGIGAAWVYLRGAGGVWTQQQSKLVGASPIGASNQGYAVAMSNAGAIVGGWKDNSHTGAIWQWVKT